MTLSPEAAEQMRALLQQEVGKAIEPLRQQIDQVDDWANGVFAALEDVVLLLKSKRPEWVAELEPSWHKAAEQYATLELGGQADDFHQTLALLEARKMLYQKLRLLGAWPAPQNP